jgi:hypothetical protein
MNEWVYYEAVLPWPFVFCVFLFLGAHPGMKLRSLADKRILVLV